MIDSRIKQALLWLLIGAALIFLFLASHRDNIANFIWQKYRWPEAALFFDKSNADLAMYIGNYYFNNVIGSRVYDTDIAKKAFEKSVSINPKILWGHYQLARVYFVKGDFNEALKEINKELEYNSGNLRSLYVRGLIYGYRNEVGDLEKAEADFSRFTLWAPKEWAGYNDLAWILSKLGKYTEAEKTINQALKEVTGGDKNPWLWNSLGVAELNLKKYSDAVTSFKKAKELAGKITLEEWHQSYPGNDPATSGSGLEAFLKAIDVNLSRAENHINS